MTTSPVSLKVGSDSASFVYQQPPGHDASLRQEVERAFSLGIRVMRSLCGAQWEAKSISIRMPPQEPINIYPDLLGVMPRFNAPENSITFAADCLIRPISNADPELRRLMQEQVQRLDNLYQDELPERVAPLIRNLLAQGTASLDVIAQRLAMSPRTLQRSLNAEGEGVIPMAAEHSIAAVLTHQEANDRSDRVAR
ncbi:MAG: AraC family transcriptional regulator ligand-binding domain-containing protein [Accumulibacter sp.]|uniref:AraC family transcriptional regulator ligand-binding domain-containing protein n=1 Tax=Accumulibacter sp. TaxID=2053492 RepID=UPI0033149591